MAEPARESIPPTGGRSAAPRPFRQIVLKIHSRCNLACDHCYVYESIDQSWRDRPVVMSRRTVDLVACRIGEHARRHALPRLRIVLHGGEPLLAGTDLIGYTVSAIRTAVAPTTDVSFTVQTNGLLLTETTLTTLYRLGVTVGVSLDGDRAANDRHRRYASGRSSYASVAAALRLLGEPRFRPMYRGILCTVDPANDPVATYEHLIGFAPPMIDLLLPHGNHTNPPPGRGSDPGLSQYASWLVAVFDRWFDAPRRETGVRLFDAVIDLLLGLPSGSEMVGLDPVDLVTVETDGSLEQVDALKTTADGLAATGLHLADHALDVAADHPGIRARRAGLAALAAECRRCALVTVCGGGLYAHRYRAGSGFTNRSVYCPDLFHLIRHIHARVARDLSARSAGAA
jgi:uncharacterized protein